MTKLITACFVCACLFASGKDPANSKPPKADDGQSWEDWLGEQIGTMKAERADEIAGMLAELENEHSVVLGKRDEFTPPSFPVQTDSGITQFARAVGEKMGCTVETLVITYGGTRYAYETVGNISLGSLVVKLNDKLKQNPNAARARIIEIMAGQTINRNMVGADKPSDWHLRLNDVQAVCLGFGTALLSAIRSATTTRDDSVNFSYQAPTSMNAVEIAWTMGAVAKLRKQGLPTPTFSDVAAKVAFKRGIESLLANERRMKIVVKVTLSALEDGSAVTMPSTLPAWDAVKDAAVPATVTRKKKMLDYWTPVPTEDEIEKAQSKEARRLLELRTQFKTLVDSKSYEQATRLLSEICLSDGVDFALSAIGPLTGGDPSSVKSGKRNIDKARWLARISEVTEARNYLRENEDVLSGKTASFYHHLEAAQRFVVLGDENRFMDEMSKVDTQSERIIAIMRGKSNYIPSVDQASNGRNLQGSPAEPAFTIAEYWWRLAKGKRKCVMDHFLKLSAAWYRQVVAKSSWKTSFKAKPSAYTLATTVTISEVKTKPEWYRIAEKRARWQPTTAELRVRIGSEPKTVGTCGVMMPVFEGARESSLSVLSSRTVVWRNRKGEKTREEVFFQPRDYWEHKTYVAGWMDERGNELRVFKVVNLPLRDDEFTDDRETCPTREHMDARIAASAASVAGDKAFLSLWASRFFGIETKEDSLVKIPCGKMAKAFVLTTGDLSTGGVFLCTYRKEWLFVEVRLAGEVSDIMGLLRKLAIGAKTISWKDTSGGSLGKEDGMLVYTMPGYVIKVDMTRSLASKFVSRIKPMLNGSRTAFMSYVPTQLEMKPSVLHVFNERTKYDAHVTKATERLENRTIGMWIGSREELLVMSGMKKVDDPVGEETFRTLRHEAFHQYLFYATGRKSNATWYNEGHATFFETSVFSSGSNPLQPVDDESLRYPRPFYKNAAAMARLMPEILTMTQDEFYDGPLKTVNDRYSAAWGLVYFLEKGIHVMNGMECYESVLPTYLALIKQEGTTWREASAKAWEKINTKRLPADFLRFWNDPTARKAARTYRPKPE